MIFRVQFSFNVCGSSQNSLVKTWKRVSENFSELDERCALCVCKATFTHRFVSPICVASGHCEINRNAVATQIDARVFCSPIIDTRDIS